MSHRAIPGSVSGTMPKGHLEQRTQESRAKARKQLGTLKQLTVQPVTRARYKESLDKFFENLKDHGLLLPKLPRELDSIVSDYLEHMWAEGLGRASASNVSAALQDSQPQLKGKLLQSWRLMRAWVTNEVPNRAPPGPKDMLFAMLGYAIFKDWHYMVITLMLGYYALPRTGEILQVKACHVSVQNPKGPAVISLGLTKSGKRQGAAESVTVYHEDLCRRLHPWKQSKPGTALIAGPRYRRRRQFNLALSNLGFDTL